MISLTELSPHPDDSLRVLERQRSQDNALTTLRSRYSRLFESKGQHRNSRKARMLEQHPDAISQVLPQSFHHLVSLYLSAGVAYAARYGSHSFTAKRNMGSTFVARRAGR